MKELSIEQKAKAYDEAIEKARIWKDKSGMPKDRQGILDDIFPELKESEDERIRKAICIYLDWLDGRNKDYQPKGEYTVKDMIALLEKQGEQKPAAWSEEDKVKINRIVACLENLNIADNDILLKDVAWLKSLRPQNTWKPSEGQMEALEHFVRSIGESGYASPYDNNTKLLYLLLSDLKKLREE